MRNFVIDYFLTPLICIITFITESLHYFVAAECSIPFLSPMEVAQTQTEADQRKMERERRRLEKERRRQEKERRKQKKLLLKTEYAIKVNNIKFCSLLKCKK